MQVRLVVTNLMLNESTNYDLAVNEKITIGRYFGSPVTLQGDRLSRNHFSLVVTDGVLTIEDLSSNGTSLNGLPLKEKSPASVKSGDIVEVPGYQMEVSIQNVSLPQQTLSEEPSAVPSKVPVSPAKRAVTTALHVLEPRETALLLLALISVALVTFFLNS